MLRTDRLMYRLNFGMHSPVGLTQKRPAEAEKRIEKAHRAKTLWA